MHDIGHSSQLGFGERGEGEGGSTPLYLPFLEGCFVTQWVR